ncbi:uncharacterized protein LOC121236897 [Juglans microcarpa x Juglans regia]|uniref:uncharacterized protein LOC121236897 n=1 Tax=Juglans microcarpa x Juglans regia TaxID=2249226 RepID=UPI001B7EC77F|nr:uncharacterized protein LOC121236897 [Juglans microcarpa x Juglans regia]
MDRQVLAPTPEDVTKTNKAEKEPNEVTPELKKPMSAEVETSKRYQLVVPYPQRLTAGQKNKYHTENQEIFKQMKISIPLLDAIQEVPLYVKFLNDLCIMNRKLNVKKKALLTGQVSTLILSGTPQKLRDLDSPNISIMIGESRIKRALLGLGSNQPVSTIYHVPIILGRPFLATSNALINCQSGVLKFTLEMNVFNACKMPSGCDDSEVHAVDIVYDFDVSELLSVFDSESAFEDDFSEQSNALVETLMRPIFEALDLLAVMKSSEEEVSTLDLKPLPEDLKYIFLGQVEGTFPIVISSQLTFRSDRLRQHRGEIGWTIADIKGIDPSICTHNIFLEGDVKLVRNAQRRLNPTMKEVMKEEVLKLLVVGIIYPISYSKWHCMMNIFNDLLDDICEAFMDDFSVFDFSSIAKPLSTLLQNDTAFVWTDECQHVFETLKKHLTVVPVMQSPRWDLAFEVMTDASDFTLGSVLGQRVGNKHSVIYYANRTLNDA